MYQPASQISQQQLMQRGRAIKDLLQQVVLAMGWQRGCAAPNRAGRNGRPGRELPKSKGCKQRAGQMLRACVAQHSHQTSTTQVGDRALKQVATSSSSAWRSCRPTLLPCTDGIAATNCRRSATPNTNSGSHTCWPSIVDASSPAARASRGPQFASTQSLGQPPLLQISTAAPLVLDGRATARAYCCTPSMEIAGSR